MQISFQMTDDILIASVCGELDHHSASTIRDEIDHTMDTFQCRNLILDFDGVTFMDSSGIGMVLGRYNKVKEKQGEIILAGCSEYVEKILSMAGIFTLISKEMTAETAIGILKQQNQQMEEESYE